MTYEHMKAAVRRGDLEGFLRAVIAGVKIEDYADLLLHAALGKNTELLLALLHQTKGSSTIESDELPLINNTPCCTHELYTVEVQNAIVQAKQESSLQDPMQFALAVACKYARYESVKALIQLGADATNMLVDTLNNVRYSYGQNGGSLEESFIQLPLKVRFDLTEEDVLATVDIILEQLPDLLARQYDRQGDHGEQYWMHALHYAARNGYCTVIERLVKAGVPVDSPAYFSKTGSKTLALQFKLFVDRTKYAACVEEYTCFKPVRATPLYFAAKTKQYHACRLLLELGANVRYRTNDSSSIETVAEETHDPALNSLIQESLLNLRV